MLSKSTILQLKLSQKTIRLKYCSVAQLCPTLCNPMTAAHQASQSFTVSWLLLFRPLPINWGLIKAEVVMQHAIPAPFHSCFTAP